MTSARIPASSSRRPRRRWLVSRLQVRIAVGVAGAALLSFALFFLEYYFLFGRNTPSGPWDGEMLWIYLRAHRVAVFQMAAFVALLTTVTILLSHRVVGPLVGLQRSFRRLGDGDLAHRVQFRKRDQLKEVRDEFNQMAAALQSLVQEDRSRARAAILSLEQARDTPDPAARAVELNKALALVRSIGGGFKL